MRDAIRVIAQVVLSLDSMHALHLVYRDSTASVLGALPGALHCVKTGWLYGWAASSF